MLLGPALSGLLAAVVVSLSFYLQEHIQLQPHGSAVLILVVTALAGWVQWAYLDRKAVPRNYQGLADVLERIHAPSTPDSPIRWTLKGLISLALSRVTGSVGFEGAAAELDYAGVMRFRSRSARWLEQTRRTDAACALSAAIGAAFGAPFAAIVVPLELGVGGGTLPAVVSALTGFLGVKMLSSCFAFKRFEITNVLDGVDFRLAGGWLALVLIAVASGLLGAAFLGFLRFCRQSLKGLAPKAISGQMIAAGVALFVLSMIDPASLLPMHGVLQDLFFNRMPASESGLLFFSKTLSVTLVVIGFGTLGIFWPIFAMGGLFGFFSHELLLKIGLQGWFGAGLPSFAPMAALGGAAGLWGAILGLPVAAALLVFELTGHIEAALPALFVAWVANRIARRFSLTFTQQDLHHVGIDIIDGRSRSVLEVLTVGDTMVVDFETIHEQAVLSDLPGKLLASRYPFLPVVRGDGIYTGMVTIDMVRDRMEETRAQGPARIEHRLFEVKDLLYRSGLKTQPLKPEQDLTAIRGRFQEVPCVPVVGEDGKIRGLLFVHHVRLAYEREIARHSLRGLQAESSV